MDTAHIRAPHGPRPVRAVLRDWVAALRPRQWTKNLVVFAGVLFTGKVTDLPALLASVAAFAIFCVLSSVGYLVNDVADLEKDRAHPVKRLRPLAAGRVRPAAAVAVAAILTVLALGGAALLAWRGPVHGRWALAFPAVAVAYLALSLSYSAYWKHRVILDLMAITAGFLLRALAGTAVLGVELSPWLFVCVSLLALVLGLGKRRHELSVNGEAPHLHRPVLAEYSRPFLDQALTTAASAAIVSYAVYSISSPTAQERPWLVVTVPLVIYGVLRYMYLVFHHEQGGQPEDMLLADRPLQLTIAIWALAAAAVFLWGR